MQVTCLSLSQPWATLVVAGAKKIETRSWGTGYRGPLAIHASARYQTLDDRVLRYDEPFATAILEARFREDDPLPLGAVLGLVLLTDCERISRAPGYPERAFGNYTPGRWAWHLARPVMFPAPIPASGRLGLWPWTVPPEHEGTVSAGLRGEALPAVDPAPAASMIGDLLDLAMKYHIRLE